MKVNPFGKRARRWVLSLLLPAFALSGQPLRANPSGGVVVHGQAIINQVSASHLQINQQTQAAIINWAEFSIGAGELTQFVQPNSSASVLNRVTGGNITQIHGQLQGNGNVFVINPNGIVIGQSGVIDVAGNAVISTLDIDNDDFLNGGPSRFYGDSQTGVTNFGTISSSGGDVVLLGGFVDNQGQIGAMNGTVALGAGGDILLEQSNGAQITVRGASDYTGTGVNNAGEVSGAAVEMKAHGNVYALAINNTGMVRASGATRSNGRVRLMASGGSSNINLGNTSNVYARNGAGGGSVRVESVGGSVTNAGTVDASGSVDGGSVAIVGNTVTTTESSVVSASGVDEGGMVQIDAVESTLVSGVVEAEASFGAGGRVEITGDEVELAGVTEVSVDGGQQGGSLRIGGEFQGRDDLGLREATLTTIGREAILTADSRFGDAGSVIVWANEDTMYLGEASASAIGPFGNGGLIEISGKERLAMRGNVAATSVNGEAGTVLFDPGTLTVGYFNNSSTDFNEIEIADINRILQGGTSVVLMTSGVGSDIVFEDVELAGSDFGGSVLSGTLDPGIDFNDPNHARNSAIQWTSDASFGAFAGGSIILNNHIRTSGEGSINLIAGWTGLESDLDLSSYVPGTGGNGVSADGSGLTENGSIIPLNEPQDLFRTYVAAGQFGENGGSILVGERSMTRHVEVGSRYGDTNLAGADILIVGSDTNSETRYAQVGFHDGGEIFAPRFNNVDNNLDPDLNGLALVDTEDKVFVAIAGQNEIDRNGDGLIDGVIAVDENGPIADTFIPYANHFNSSRAGNWWWQQIDAASQTVGHSGYFANYTSTQAGGNRPEMGAGSATNGADINVIAKGNVEVLSGGRTASTAMIGHGGDGSGWATSRSLRNGGTENGELFRSWSINGATNDRSAVSIARLAPVYGDINVFAGVEEVTAIDDQGNVVATLGTQGNVIVRGTQRMGSAQDPTNEENGGGTESPAQIGHGGSGQFGVFSGDITVAAAGSVELRAGSFNKNSAVIGHNVNGLAYWNPTDNVDQQLRLFTSVEDFDDPLLRRGVLFSTNPTNIPSQTSDTNAENTTGDTATNRPTNGSRDLSPTLSTRPGIEVEALDGSVVKGFHGNISVTAENGDVSVIGYSTPDRSDGTVTLGESDATVQNGLTTNRNRRYAQIGHGGSVDAQWAEESGYVPNRSDRFREIVQYRAPNDTTGSASIVGERGAGRDRAMTFMTITGDIEVDAGGNLLIQAGNDQYSFAQVGHGGSDVADLETSSFINGDIDVTLGGALDIIGSGSVAAYTGNGVNRELSAYAQLGHGGFRSGFMAFYGDINVATQGDITLTGGAYGDSYAKIGHQGSQDNGQVGGDFLREENFDFDSASTDVTTNIVGNTATVTYAATNATGLTASQSFNDISTTNISVTTEGEITMNHLGEAVGFNDNQDIQNQAENPTDLGRLSLRRTQTTAQIDNTYVQIGHGGTDTDPFNRGNAATNYGDKIGDITVVANGGDITMENGNGVQRWTRIGHGIGRDGRGDVGGESLELAGRIEVRASGDINVDASAAASYGLVVNADSVTAFRAQLLANGEEVGDPSINNPVAIGHGGAGGNNGLIVLDSGQVNGVAANSDIIVESGGNISVTAGNGQNTSSAQIGHGFSDLEGDSNNNRKNGEANGFAGDISVTSAGNLSVKGTDLAFLLEPLDSTDSAISIVGGFAAVGHGGYGVDAESHGDINVFVGNNLSVSAQQRTQAAATRLPTSSSSYIYTPPTASVQSTNIASVFNFAKIGHVTVENGNVNGGLGDAIINSTQTGDITVVVGNNLALNGGTTFDESAAPVVGAFAQIGHGGPGIAGDEFSGDVTVLVRNNIETTGGTESVDSLQPINNYAMIGNGDRVGFDPTAGNASVFLSESLGPRAGNIVVAAGNSATFTNTLIGHLDRAESSQASTGTTQVAVSRNNPFFRGSGTLTSTGSVFSSGSGGGERLEFYMPARSNNLIDNTTRINERTATYTSGTPGNFVGLDGSGTETSGRDDEVYLTPDLWWDAAGFGAANGFSGGGAFPTDAISGQGGGIAEVNTPGGFPNLASLTAGALGTSATLYRGGNGVNGAGNYTFFYDAVEAVEAPSLPGPPPPVPPVFAPFPFINFLFEEQFDSFDRYQEFLENGLTGDRTGVGNALGLFETDEVESEEAGSMRMENRLDNLFGSRRDSFSEEEQDEERESRRRRGAGGVGPIGLTFYVFEPGTNRYSSYRVFGTAFEQFYPVN